MTLTSIQPPAPFSSTAEVGEPVVPCGKLCAESMSEAQQVTGELKEQMAEATALIEETESKGQEAAGLLQDPKIQDAVSKARAKAAELEVAANALAEAQAEIDALNDQLGGALDAAKTEAQNQLIAELAAASGLPFAPATSLSESDLAQGAAQFGLGPALAALDAVEARIGQAQQRLGMLSAGVGAMQAAFMAAQGALALADQAAKAAAVANGAYEAVRNAEETGRRVEQKAKELGATKKEAEKVRQDVASACCAEAAVASPTVQALDEAIAESEGVTEDAFEAAAQLEETLSGAQGLIEEHSPDLTPLQLMSQLAQGFTEGGVMGALSVASQFESFESLLESNEMLHSALLAAGVAGAGLTMLREVSGVVTGLPFPVGSGFTAAGLVSAGLAGASALQEMNAVFGSMEWNPATARWDTMQLVPIPGGC